MDTSSPVVMLDDAAHLHINNYGIPSAHHSQISLPSFKHLEPYYLRSQYPLPPCHYSGTSHYAPHTGPQQQQESATPLQIMVAPQWDSPTYHDGAGGSDSEADDIGHHMHHSPPKTKWRKQALICTECMRRGIKCTSVRSKPLTCTPCTRRGEEAGCRWCSIEPEPVQFPLPRLKKKDNLPVNRNKFATKAEFDNLKSQFNQLAVLVQHLTPTSAMIGAIPSEAVSGYNPGASSSIPNVYSSLMPPPHLASQPYSQLDTSLSSIRYNQT